MLDCFGINKPSEVSEKGARLPPDFFLRQHAG
jgi:hypothetical protein